ncbi:MAG: hypothetical protein ACJASQ_002458 [Crocinitomicaceae bacterium]|jgi:hypothetical protein
MIKSKYILLVFCALLLLGCKKDEPIPCQETGNKNCEDIQNVKNFFYFKVGSYWVYEEETSGDLDTIYVTEASENPSNYDFDVRVYSTYEGYFYHYWPEYSPVPGTNEYGIVCKTCLFIKRSKYKPGDYVGEATSCFFVPIVGTEETNWTVLYPSNKVRITSIDSVFDIGGIEFDRTITVHEEHSHMNNYSPTNHYLSENVGLTRKELIDSNQVWNLIDYYIEP